MSPPMTADPTPDIPALVREALRNAIDNGFDVRTWTPDFLTDDLMMFDADLARCDRASIHSAVTEWLADNHAWSESR
jgi:hypothetical protein